MSRVVFESSTRSFLQKASRSLNGAADEIGSFMHDFDAEDVRRIAGKLVNNDTELVAIGPDLQLDHGLQLAQHLNEAHPEVSVVLVTKPGSDVWEPALRAGVADVIAPTANGQEIGRVLNAVLDRSAKRKKNLAGSIPPAPGAPEPVAPQRRVITVISPKGGSGKTMTSTNLAVGLAQLHPGEVVIVDFDFEFGDVSNALLLDPDHSIYDATRKAGKLDLTTLKVFLAPHPSGLYALVAPPSPELAEEVQPAAARAVIEALASQFRYVVIDTASGMDEYTLTAMEASTDIILLTSMDVSGVRALSKAVDVLDRLNMKRQRRHFLLNRANARVGLSRRDIEELVGAPVDVEVESSRAVALSMNQGSPILESSPRSRVGKQLTALLQEFSPTPEASKPWRLRP